MYAEAVHAVEAAVADDLVYVVASRAAASTAASAPYHDAIGGYAFYRCENVLKQQGVVFGGRVSPRVGFVPDLPFLDLFFVAAHNLFDIVGE